MILESLITCLHCGTAKTESMPTDACQFFYECSGCRREASAKTGRLMRVLFLRLGALSADSSPALG